jgi:hypothetical protein
MTSEPTDYTPIDHTPLDYEAPNVRVHALYPATPFACPESITVELHTAGGGTLTYDIRAAVDALASVPAVARAAAMGEKP